MVAVDLGPPAERLELGVGHRLEELELLREAQEHPGLPPRPGRERRVALLGAGAAVVAVDDVEQALVGHPPALVPDVAAPALADGEAGGGAGVEAEPLEERHRAVPLLEERVAQPVREGERPQRAHRVGEERVRAVEGVDEPAAVGGAGPAPGLHRPARLERQLAQLALLPLGGVAPLEGEPAQGAPGAHVVEAVVVHPHVGHVGRHPRVGALAAQLEEALVAGGVELQEGGAELEALRPVRPAAGRVAAAQGEDRRAVRGVPGLLEGQDLLRGERPHPRDRRDEVGGAQRLVDADHRFPPRSVSAHLAWPSYTRRDRGNGTPSAISVARRSQMFSTVG